MRILQSREQMLNDLETGTRPFTADQAWWVSTINAGRETGFDMAKVRRYLIIQERHLVSNYEEVERLVPGQSLVPV
jgi:DNA-binding transcriptional MerR regulator